RLPQTLFCDTACEAEVLLRRGSADCIRARRYTRSSLRGRIYDGICPYTCSSSRDPLDIVGGSIYVATWPLGGQIWKCCVEKTMGGSTVNRGHGAHHRAIRCCSAREGRPRRFGGAQRDGGTCNDRSACLVQPWAVSPAAMAGVVCCTWDTRAWGGQT